MKLRRNLMAILLGLSTVVAMAQTGTETLQIKEEGKTVFNPHWFLQVNGGVGYTIGETDFSDLISPAAQLELGYWFNPYIALRFGLSGWQAKGGWSNGPDYKYNYLEGNVDFMLDLSTLFCGYNYKRFFNAYLFVGVGLNGAFNNDEATELYNEGYNYTKYWEKNKIGPAGRFGIGTNLRISDHVFFNIELNGHAITDKFNSKGSNSADWQFNGLVGFTFKFGKTYTQTEPVYYEPAPPAPAPAPKAKPQPKPEPKPAPKVEPIRRDIFFEINKADIRESEQSKVDDLVAYMKEHPDSKITITGHADKQTGTTEINQKLSKKRVESVAEALKDKGIAESRITTEAKGDTVQPFSTMEENRVSICIAE